MNPLADRDDCTLLVIDAQERLVPALHDGAAVIRHCLQLADAARELGVHVIGTEENANGLGPLIDDVASRCDTILAKQFFAATAEAGFLHRLPAGRHTIVVVGCEAHVCVLQTVVGLIEAGYAVKWVADAIGSRRPHDRLAATERARHLGADIVTTEMIVFEWLRTCEHPSFRRLLEIVR